mgnify:CR=1 FL=1
MIRINLLPHRQERRKAQRKHLAILAGFEHCRATAW